ncbi:MAG: diversity-generating retroelement protein Avd [Candidatus Competibacterales bacterium]
MLRCFRPPKAASNGVANIIHWYHTLNEILAAVERFPKHVHLTLANPMANNALDILDGIIQAIYRPKEPLDALSQINLNLERLRVLLRLVHEWRYLPTAQYEHLARQLEEAGRMVGGWQRSLSL